jgi:bacterioferritin-associated ferredoxin
MDFKNVPGMSDNTKKLRETLGVTEHCAKCTNCGLCIKSKTFEDKRREQYNYKKGRKQ